MTTISAHRAPPRAPDRHAPITAGDPDVVRTARSIRSEDRGPKGPKRGQAASSKPAQELCLYLSLSLSISLDSL